MSKQTPFFKFDPMQWLGGAIQNCTLEEKGLFIDLCAHYWKHYKPVKVDAKFKVRYRYLEGTLTDLIGTLSDLDFITVSEAGITVNFLDELMDDRQEFLKKCSKAGKKSASIKGTSSNKKEERRKKSVDSRKKTNTTAKADIDRIYQNYPRKQGKASALNAIRTSLKKVEFDFLMDAVCEYTVATAGQDMQFIPHPTTWFNQERYNDDRSTWSAWKNSDLFGKPQDHNEGSFTNHVEKRKDY